MLRRSIAACAVACALLACSPWGFVEPKTPPIAAFAAPPNQLAQICVLRPHLLAGAVTFPVRDNGKLVGATRGASYFCYWAQPGQHRVTSEADDVQEANVQTIAGARYYLHQRVKNTFGFVSSPMEWVSETEARTMVETCDYRVLTEVPDGAERPPANPIAAARP